MEGNPPTEIKLQGLQERMLHIKLAHVALHTQLVSFLPSSPLCFCQLFQIQVVKKKKVIMGCMHGATIERLGEPRANTCYLKK